MFVIVELQNRGEDIVFGPFESIEIANNYLELNLHHSNMYSIVPITIIPPGITFASKLAMCNHWHFSYGQWCILERNVPCLIDKIDTLIMEFYHRNNKGKAIPFRASTFTYLDATPTQSVIKDYQDYIDLVGIHIKSQNQFQRKIKHYFTWENNELRYSKHRKTHPELIDPSILLTTPSGIQYISQPDNKGQKSFQVYTNTPNQGHYLDSTVLTDLFNQVLTSIDEFVF
jgi:hypothetical protein